MKHDMALQAEERDCYLACALPRDRRPEPRHTDGASRRDHQGRKGIGVPQPLGIDRGELDQIVIEGGAHVATC